MNLSFSLYRLQTIDTKRQKINQRIAQIDAELSADEAIKACLKAKEQAEQDLKQTQSKLRDVAQQVAAKRMKLELNQNQLFGGKIRNPKNLQDLQAEADFLRKSIQELEDQQIEVMLQLEADQHELEEAEQAYKNCLSERATQNALLLGEKHQLENDLVGLNAQREALVQTLPADVLSQYESLLKIKAGKAVAMIVEDTCEACGMTISPADMQAARSPNIVAYCKTCGRILYKA